MMIDIRLWSWHACFDYATSQLRATEKGTYPEIQFVHLKMSTLRGTLKSDC